MARTCQDAAGVCHEGEGDSDIAMSDQPPISELTREQLYERVWATPLQRLAVEFGLSDVALAKRCRRLQVPTPPRGYWARLEAGQTPRRAKLLPLKHSETPEAESPAQPPPIRIKATTSGLHRVAEQLHIALRAADPDQDGQLRVYSKPEIPDALISPKAISSTVRLCDGIVRGLEARGVPFKVSRSSYRSGYFEAKRTRFFLNFEEPIVSVVLEVTDAMKRRPSWEWQRTERRPAGKITVQLRTEDARGHPADSFHEKDHPDLGSLATAVVEHIQRYFAEKERKQEEESARWRQQQIEWQQRQVEEKQRQHYAALEQTAQSRESDLFHASEWWRLHENLRHFIDSCEARWKRSQPELTPEQTAWLVWARRTADQLSPDKDGYPDPARDGPFDAAAFPVGGPGPTSRGFPRPPTLPQVPIAEVSHLASSDQRRDPYPFWLRHR